MKIKIILHIILPTILALTLCFGCAKAQADDVTMVGAFLFADEIF